MYKVGGRVAKKRLLVQTQDEQEVRYKIQLEHTWVQRTMSEKWRLNSDMTAVPWRRLPSKCRERLAYTEKTYIKKEGCNGGATLRKIVRKVVKTCGAAQAVLTQSVATLLYNLRMQLIVWRAAQAVLTRRDPCHTINHTGGRNLVTCDYWSR